MVTTNALFYAVMAPSKVKVMDVTELEIAILELEKPQAVQDVCDDVQSFSCPGGFP